MIDVGVWPNYGDNTSRCLDTASCHLILYVDREIADVMCPLKLNTISHRVETSNPLTGMQRSAGIWVNGSVIHGWLEGVCYWRIKRCTLRHNTNILSDSVAGWGENGLMPSSCLYWWNVLCCCNELKMSFM